LYLTLFARGLLYLALFAPPLLSLAWLGPFYLFCYRTTTFLGQAPTNKLDHIKAGHAMPDLDHLVAWWLIVVLRSIYPWLAVGLVALAFRRGSRAALWALLLWAPFAFVFIIDPGGWFYWYFD
jgi:hypothetical protein